MLGAGKQTFEERNFVKGLYVFLEMLPFFGIAGIFVIQVTTWWVVVGRLISGKADRMYVLMLIPGAVFAGVIWLIIIQMPEALRRKG